MLQTPPFCLKYAFQRLLVPLGSQPLSPFLLFPFPADLLQTLDRIRSALSCPPHLQSHLLSGSSHFMSMVLTSVLSCSQLPAHPVRPTPQTQCRISLPSKACAHLPALALFMCLLCRQETGRLYVPLFVHRHVLYPLTLFSH